MLLMRRCGEMVIITVSKTVVLGSSPSTFAIIINKENKLFKTLLTGSAGLFLASPALAAGGPSLMGEVRIGDVRENKSDSTEFKVEYWDTANLVNFAAELQAKQAENAGSVDSKISFKAGPVLPQVLGVTPIAYAEVGQALKSGNNYTFWGAGIKTSVSVYGPVSVGIGYRHREGFEVGKMNEERLNGGVSIAVNQNYSLGAQYYRTRGTANSDAIGVSVTRKF